MAGLDERDVNRESCRDGQGGSCEGISANIPRTPTRYVVECLNNILHSIRKDNIFSHKVYVALLYNDGTERKRTLTVRVVNSTATWDEPLTLYVCLVVVTKRCPYEINCRSLIFIHIHASKRVCIDID